MAREVKAPNPPKYDPETDGPLRRIRVGLTENLRKSGLSPMRSLLKKGYDPDRGQYNEDGADTLDPDTGSVEVVMPEAKWRKEIRDPAKKQARALQALNTKELKGKDGGSYRDQSLEDESFKGKEFIDEIIRREGEQD